MDISVGLVIGLVLAALFLGDKIFAAFKGRGVNLPKMARQLDDLHLWHSKEDDEGVKIWYVRRSLEEAIHSLSQNIAQQTEILRDIHNEQKATRQSLKELKEFKEQEH